MVVAGLQPHIVYEETFEPKLINRKTGGALHVTADEAVLLKSWDGSVSATRLSIAASMNGLEIEPWQVEQFFRRLDRLGCLAVTAPNIPAFVGPPSGISKVEDVVPQLRADLVLTKAARSRAVVHVKDPLSGRAFSLFDTEVSVARMLDGRRPVREVVDNAGKLGIEVTLDSLQHFIKHLKGYRFIADDGSEAVTSWPKRTPWTEEERQLYQSSMKMLREGHYAEALSFAQSLEAVGPQREEVKALKHRVELESEGVVELVATFGELHATPVVKPPPPAPKVEVPVAPAPPTPLEQVTARVRPRLKVLLGVAVAVGLLAVLLRPVPATVTVACELQPETLGVPRTTRGGKVSVQDVPLGRLVKKGAVVARLGPGAPVAGLDEHIKELEKTLAALPPAADEKKVAPVRQALAKATNLALVLEQSRTKGSKAQQARTEKKLAVTVRERDEAKKKVEALTHELQRASLQADLKLSKEKKDVVDGTLSKSLIVAPASGLFVSVGPLPEELGVNDSYGLVVSPEFKLVTSEPVPEGVQGAVFRSGEFEVEPPVVAGAVKFPVRSVLVGAKGALELRLGRRPWVVSLFRR